MLAGSFECCMCACAMGFFLDMKSYISCFGTWSGYKIQISLVYSACQHFSGHDQP